jgi:hypothetical protein
MVPMWENILQQVEMAAQEQKAAAESALQGLAGKARAEREALQARMDKLAWKDRLKEDAGWFDVVREIEYFFWRGTEGRAEHVEEVDKLFDQALKAEKAYQTERTALQCGPDEESAKKWEIVCESCKVLMTEEYLVRQIEEKGQAASKKLSRRQTQAVDFYDRVHKIIRERCHQITGM